MYTWISSIVRLINAPNIMVRTPHPAGEYRCKFLINGKKSRPRGTKATILSAISPQFGKYSSEGGAKNFLLRTAKYDGITISACPPKLTRDRVPPPSFNG